ncbi:MAG: hypothetical protein ACREVJ_09115 [Gammaproteobacteria bacterium]
MCQSHRVSVKRYRERMTQAGYQHIAAYLPPEDWRRYPLPDGSVLQEDFR